MSAFDVDGARNTVGDVTPIVDGNRITTAYPADLIDRAGQGWVWMAATTLDGDDIDYCKPPAWKAAHFA